MKLGIMQPYFFPYIGYWQLMNLVDVYVIYDDVNYIKGGWMNRNRILNNNDINYFNLSLINASQNSIINEVRVNLDEKIINKNLKTIQFSYGKAPYFKDVFPIIEKILTYNEENLALYLKHSFELICQYLQINTKFMLSSEIEKDNSLKGQDKILEICKKLGATEYYNAIGGKEIYDSNKFNDNGIGLFFLKTKEFSYKQFNDNFVENLSIIDILMFNSKDECRNLLQQYELIK